MCPYLKRTKKWWMIMLSVALLFAIAIPSMATEYEEELEELGDSIDELEGTTADLEAQLSELNAEILAANEELEAVNLMIELTESEIVKTLENLEQSKIDEATQYENMKIRIQYMYEGGSTSLLEVLFGAESIADFINLVDFVTNVTEYDRNMLLELVAIREEIEYEEANLEEEERVLYELQQEAIAKAAELQEVADSLSIDLDTALAEIEEYEAEVAKVEAEKEEAERIAAEEAAAKAEAEAEAEAENNSSSDSNADTGSSSNGGDDYSASVSEVELLAALLDCEAEANYNSMLAVATVIMNRVESSKFPNTISGVIYESGQFSPTWTGKLERRLELGASSTAYSVAQDAINGARYDAVSNCYYFLMASSTSRDGVNVGGNLFFVSW